MINLACLAQKSLGNSVPSCRVPSSDSVLESTLLLRKPFVQCFQLARLALSLDKIITIPDWSTTWRVHKAWCIQILPCQELHSPRGKWGKWGKLSDDADMTPFVMHPKLPTRASSAAMSAIFCAMFAMSFCTSSSRLGRCSKDISKYDMLCHIVRTLQTTIIWGASIDRIESCIWISPGLWTLSALCLAVLSSPWWCKDQRSTSHDNGWQ